MFEVIAARWQQGHRTTKYPDGPAPPMPDRFRGRLVIDVAKCTDGCRTCLQACPTAAVSLTDKLRIDLGRCLFCAECVAACPQQAITHTNEYRLAAGRRADLVVGHDDRDLHLAAAMDAKLMKLFGRPYRAR